MSAPEMPTERLMLRGFRPEDWRVLARFYSDDSVMRHMLPGRGLTPKDAEQRAKSNIHNFNESWRERGYGVWAVASRESGHLIGQCGLRFVPEAYDGKGAVELLYLLNKTHWGKGLASEAANAAVRHAFNATALPALFAVTSPQNAGSRNVLRKLGFQEQGMRVLWERDVLWHDLAKQD
ncbi:GNAT family N-acetyltransferase [Ferrovibrio sp.]|uniref:GNAT family N-acetyltransferase n=1 Tax=Ferrovibrio sp. TaxID=1917215 RepID=UPI0025B7FF8E|nr:GNAT family N-acetyltransferase [Ferrovibrio sp.]MBX3456478.1 GNAT family N-acetyltransferase [Ferrovibrio sp.]